MQHRLLSNYCCCTGSVYAESRPGPGGMGFRWRRRCFGDAHVAARRPPPLPQPAITLDGQTGKSRSPRLREVP